MKSLFSQSALFSPQFWVFEAIFEARGQNFPFLKNSVCTFYCTQNDRFKRMVLSVRNQTSRVIAKLGVNFIDSEDQVLISLWLLKKLAIPTKPKNQLVRLQTEKLEHLFFKSWQLSDPQYNLWEVHSQSQLQWNLTRKWLWTSPHPHKLKGSSNNK